MNARATHGDLRVAERGRDGDGGALAARNERVAILERDGQRLTRGLRREIPTMMRERELLWKTPFDHHQGRRHSGFRPACCGSLSRFRLEICARGTDARGSRSVGARRRSRSALRARAGAPRVVRARACA